MADIGYRIRRRREELKMTQQELADKLGYKNKSSIAKIETGTNDIVQSKVVEFAKVLNTTVADLMGWDKADNSFSGKEAPKEVYDKFFNNIEKHHSKRAEILDIYNQLSPENQQKTLSYSKNLLSIQQMDEELNAACDKGATEEQKTAADNIMMDDGEWE